MAVYGSALYGVATYGAASPTTPTAGDTAGFTEGASVTTSGGTTTKSAADTGAFTDAGFLAGGASAILLPQPVALTGLAPVYSAVNPTDYFAKADDLILCVNNAGGSPVIVTVVDSGRTAGGSVAVNPTVTVPSGGLRFIHFPKALADTTDLLAVQYSSTVGVTAALLMM